MNDWAEVLSIIGTVVLMLAVFVGAYYVSKYVGKHYQPGHGFSKNITVLDSANVGKDRALLIVRVGEKAFLIGSAPQAFTLLSELDAEQFAAVSAEAPPSQKDFLSVFRGVIKGRKPGDGD
jgi:flagellar biogenesis protein FliO